MTKTLTVDKDFSLAGAALQFRNIRSTDLAFLVSPNLGPQLIGDESVMASDDTKAKPLYDEVVKDRVAVWISQNSTDSEDVQPATSFRQ